MSHDFDKLLRVGGVLPLLLQSSGWCAMERGLELSEPIDLVKAIYIVDLEHVSNFWNDWQGLERFILAIPMVGGRKLTYLNRTAKLFELYIVGRDNPGQLVPFAPPSRDVQEIAFAAQELALDRNSDQPPSSCDLLWCACRLDTALSEALQESGLQIESLAAAIVQRRK